MKQLITSLCLLILFSPAIAQTGKISGVVKDKKTEAIIADATILLEGTTLGAVSDSNGKFSIKDIPTNSYNIKASVIGYEPTVLYNIVVSSGNEQVLLIEMDNSSVTSLKEVVIRRNPFAKNAETPLSLQNLSAQEIKSNPGGNFDVSRVIQAFP